MTQLPRAVLRIGLALLVGASAATGSAADKKDASINVSGTETFEAEYVGDNGDNGKRNELAYGDDDDYTRFRNILHLRAKGLNFSGGLRVDTLFYSGPPGRVTREEFIPGGSGYTTLNFDNDYRIERVHGTVTLGGLEATFGDFHVNFGRGMALSLIKLDDVGEDNAMRGARLTYRIARKGKLDLLGGVVNTLNTDPTTRHIIEDDPLDRILGLRGEWQILDAIGLGIHGVLVKPRFSSDQDVSPERLHVDQGPGVQVMTGGGSLEAHLEGFHLYVEGNGQHHTNYRIADSAGRNLVPSQTCPFPYGIADSARRKGTGAAVFGELSYDLTPFSIKGEGIYYRRWLMEGPYRGPVASNISFAQPIAYNQMVTLEPKFVPIKSFGNTYGGRLSGSVFIEAIDLEIALKSAFLRYLGGLFPQGEWRDHPKTVVIHPIMTLKKEFDDMEIEANLNGGFRYETTSEPDDADHHSGHLWHVELGTTVPLKGAHSLEAKGEVRRHELMVTEGTQYWVSLAMISYHLSERFDLSLTHEYSDEVAGGTQKIGAVKWPFPKHHYASLLASITMPEPVKGLRFQLFFGSQRGGIKCVGGVCRKYPDSIGARLEAVYRF